MGLFLNTNFLTKVAETLFNSLGYFETTHKIENFVAKIWATISKIGLIFRQTTGHTAYKHKKWRGNYNQNYFKWAISGLFFFIFVFSIQLRVNVQFKFLLMTGFEPQTSGFGNDCSTNWATTTALPPTPQKILIICSIKVSDKRKGPNSCCKKTNLNTIVTKFKSGADVVNKF